MRPDDVKRALDALASESPDPTSGADAAVTRGRRRIVQRRIGLAGVAAALIAGVVVTGGVVRRDRDNDRVSSVPVTTISTPPAPETTSPTATTPTTRPLDKSRYAPLSVRIGSPTEVWICGDPFQVSTDGGQNWRPVTIPRPTTASPGGEYEQPSICTAAPGGAWLLRATGEVRRPELVRIREPGDRVEVMPFENLSHGSTIYAMSFVDANVGWALAQSGIGDPVDTELYATEDGGQTWVLRNAHAPLHLSPTISQPPGLLTFVSSDVGWGIGGGAQLETTSDGGRTWRSVDVPALPALGDFASYLNGVFATGDSLVAWGGRSTGLLYTPNFDVSTDGGNTWSERLGPNDVQPSGTGVSLFDAVDAGSWFLAATNQLYATDDGGATWTQVAEFAGMDHITSVGFLTPKIGFVSGVGRAPVANSSVALQTSDGGATWAIVGTSGPPLVKGGDTINTPGGFVGCPTRPLTPVRTSNPPPGLVDAAKGYMGAIVAQTPVTVDHVYRVAEAAGTFGSLFKFQVGSCGKETVENAWVVELHGPVGQGGGGSTDQTQLVLAHYADGWHVFGRYH